VCLLSWCVADVVVPCSAMVASWVSQASFEPLGLTIAVAKDRAIESMMQVRENLLLERAMSVTGQHEHGSRPAAQARQHKQRAVTTLSLTENSCTAITCSTICCREVSCAVRCGCLSGRTHVLVGPAADNRTARSIAQLVRYSHQKQDGVGLPACFAHVVSSLPLSVVLLCQVGGNFVLNCLGDAEAGPQ